MTRPLLETGRELRIHVEAWDDGQAQLCRTLLQVAPHVEDLTPIVEHLLAGLEGRRKSED